MSGCSGGWPKSAGEYFKSKGLPGADCAPYTSGPCTDKMSNAEEGCMGTSVSTSYSEGICWGSQKSWLNFGKYSEARISEVKMINGHADMQQDLVAHGPLSACFNFFKEFGEYKGGVLKTATPDAGGHAVTVTGYANDGDGTPYWLIRNSWGAGWGEGGYCRYLRGTNMANLETGVASYILSGSGKSATVGQAQPSIQNMSSKPMPGAWVARNLTDDVVLEAKAAVQDHISASESGVDVQVLSASSQVVQGVNVYLRVRAATQMLGTSVYGQEFGALAFKPPVYGGAYEVPHFSVVKLKPSSEVVVV